MNPTNRAHELTPGGGTGAQPLSTPSVVRQHGEPLHSVNGASSPTSSRPTKGTTPPEQPAVSVPVFARVVRRWDTLPGRARLPGWRGVGAARTLREMPDAVFVRFRAVAP